MEPRQCGECSLCCKLLGVRELQKPRNVWCKHNHADKTKGCTIWNKEGYPETCGGFKCGWLDREDVLPDSMRPDRVHAFITGFSEGRGIAIYVDPGYPLAHRQEPWKSLLDGCWRQGLTIIAMISPKKVERLTHTGWVVSRDFKEEGDQTTIPIKEMVQLIAK